MVTTMLDNAKAKTIKLLLYDGTLKGVIRADSSWHSGELYSAPRESADDLISSEALISSDGHSKFGVYLLLSEDVVYVGQSSDLSKRIKQHIIGKDWWESVVVLTTSNDSLTRSDIDYLESVLISKASQNNQLDCDNKNRGNNPKVDPFRKSTLDQYLDEALFLMRLIGISVFGEVSKSNKKKSKTALISVDTVSHKNYGKDQDSKQYYDEFGEKKQNLFSLVEGYMSSFGKDIRKEVPKNNRYVRFKKVKTDKTFFCVKELKSEVQIRLKLIPDKIELIPGFVEDTRQKGSNWGIEVGVQITIKSPEDFERVQHLINRAYKEN